MADIHNVINSQSSNKDYSSFEGSPYLNEKFVIGTIINSKEDKRYRFLLRYNIYEDKIEIEKDKNSIVNLGKEFYFNVIIDNKKFMLTEYQYKTNKGYLEILYQNKDKSNNLYLKHTRTLISAKKAQSSYEKDKPAKFNQSESFFYEHNNKIVSLPSRKKDFFKLFSSNSKVIEEYAKKNKLGIKDKNDLIKIFQFYSSLN